jgi:predicted phage-related endonuclease
MSDFSPEVRNSGWWSGDSRMAANGQAATAILIKQGKMEREEISDLEHVKMGHVMQPVIGRLAQERLGIELKDAAYPLTHPKESWLRSHFDFISADNKVLVEAKNYSSFMRSKFDPETCLMPDSDRIQCIHEATVHGAEIVYLAVLLGGSEFITVRQEVTPEMKEEHVKWCARWWGHVVANTLPEPQTVEECKISFPVSEEGMVVATRELEAAARNYSYYSKLRKEAEDQEENCKQALMKAMGSKSVLSTIDGTVLATWKSAKASAKFNTTAFRAAYPQMYDQFVQEVPGSRRFLIK